jgi:hypothetical protein
LNGIQPLSMRRRGNELVLLHDAGVHHPGDQCFSQFPRADHSDLCFRKHAVPFQ